MTVEAKWLPLLAPVWQKGMVVRLIAAVVVAILLGRGDAVQALNPSLKISQYGHRAWRIGDAGLDSTPNDITQTSDGQIWVGTVNGLYRFDGKQFIRWKPAAGSPVELGLVYSLFGARNGALYVGAREHLYKVFHETLSIVPIASYAAHDFLQNKDGTVWFYRNDRYSSDNVCSIGSAGPRCYGRKDGLSCDANGTLASDGATGLWIGGESGICRWKPGSSSHLYALPGIDAIASDRHSSTWAGAGIDGKNVGLWKFTDDKWKRFTSSKSDSRLKTIRPLYFDRNDALWFSNNDEGLDRVVGGKFDHVDHSDGLTSDVVNSIMEDSEGSIWVATTHGIDQFFQRPIVSFTSREGLAQSAVLSVAPMRDGGVVVLEDGPIETISPSGTVSQLARIPASGSHGSVFADSVGRTWIAPGPDGRLLVIDAHRHIRRLRQSGLPYYTVGFAEDSRRAIWIGGIAAQKRPIIGSLERIDRADTTRRAVPPLQVGSHGAIVSVTSDLVGGLWIGAVQGGLFHWRDGQFDHVHDFGPPPDGMIRQIDAIAPAEIWVATHRGAVWVKNGVTRTLDTTSGLPCNTLNGISIDIVGNLWMTTQCGLVEVSAKELGQWRKQPSYRVRFIKLGAASGYNGDESSTLLRSNDGNLWFEGGFAANEIDPRNVFINSMVPPLQVQGVTADGRSLNVSARTILPKLTRDVEIDYNALSYLQPGLLKFRYRLFGHDRGWIEAGNRRQAFFNDLPPGSYRFEVTACNEDTICNTQGASVLLVIPPAWWQTWLFRTLCIVGIFAVTVAVVRWRLSLRDNAMRVRFDDRLEERTRIARDLHDTLMQTVLASKLLAENGQMIETAAEGRDAFGRLSTWLGSAADEGRAAVASLRNSTMQTNHLAQALEAVAREGRTGPVIETSIVVTGKVRDLHPVARDEIHRIGVEATRNARAYSGASHIDIRIDYSQGFTLRIADDGNGIDQEVLKQGKAGHFGLIGMRERAQHIGAKLLITSSKTGTEVALTVPGNVVFADKSWLIRRLYHSWTRVRVRSTGK